MKIKDADSIVQLHSPTRASSGERVGAGVEVGGNGVDVGPSAPKPQANDVVSSNDTIKNRNALRSVDVLFWIFMIANHP